MSRENRYDDFFTFEVARMDSVGEIMGFIKTHWDSNHILANDKEFFKYHYGNLDNKDQLNVFVMREKNGAIAGILGQVVYGRDDLGIHFSGSITKARADLDVPMAGLELQKRLYKHFGEFVEVACGANNKTIVPLFTNVFKYQSGVMDLYFLLNKSMSEFKLIKVSGDTRNKAIQESGLYILERIYDLDSLNFDFIKRYERLPFKNKNFLDHRYFKHPIYNYLSYVVKVGNKCLGIVFFRIVEYQGARILMLVDFVGELSCFAYIGQPLCDLLSEFNAECIHFLVAGLKQDFLEKAGFSRVDLDSKEIVIPTYFEPFLSENIKNYYIKSRPEMVIFKALGDQDNPKYKAVSQ
ncbi:hypothetical protein [Helicobacter labetoulli]|uniref:hypothetical protein n=1 Tax=Helicobacter labetoulli TaxID=2315333 RepID=UPI000EF64784|nr:hypothetical protein [Helicobacter labetoulli]